MLKKVVSLFVIVMAVAWGATHLGTATKTTKVYDYNYETGKYDLIKVEEEDIEGIFDEEVEIHFATDVTQL